MAKSKKFPYPIALPSVLVGKELLPDFCGNVLCSVFAKYYCDESDQVSWDHGQQRQYFLNEPNIQKQMLKDYFSINDKSGALGWIHQWGLPSKSLDLNLVVSSAKGLAWIARLHKAAKDRDIKVLKSYFRNLGHKPLNPKKSDRKSSFTFKFMNLQNIEPQASASNSSFCVFSPTPQIKTSPIYNIVDGKLSAIDPVNLILKVPSSFLSLLKSTEVDPFWIYQVLAYSYIRLAFTELLRGVQPGLEVVFFARKPPEIEVNLLARPQIEYPYQAMVVVLCELFAGAQGWKSCKACGKPFRPENRSDQKTCSSACRQNKYRKEAGKE